MEMIQITITKNEENQRLDRFLKKYLRNAPLSYIYKLIRTNVKVNGIRAKEDQKLEAGDEILLSISQEEEEAYRVKEKTPRAKKQFGIAYEDDQLLVVEKPFGLLTHGTEIEKRNTLTNQVLSYLIETGDYSPRLEKTFIPSPSNRLDRNTTGLILFGKNYAALQCLNQMIRGRNHIRKFYLTIVLGQLKEQLRLTGQMERLQESNKTVVLSEVTEGGKEMVTIVTPLEHSKGYTLVEVELVTGRTHQIRAHLSSAGFPIIGDEKYGNRQVNQEMERRFKLTTQLLHAYRLSFDQMEPPLSHLQGRVIEAQLPIQFQQIKNSIFRQR